MIRVQKQLKLNQLDSLRNKKCDFSIAVMDTGASNHPDIKNQIIDFQDFVNNKTELYDDNGHGTHISGIICGNGNMSKGKIKGVFPGANIVVLKILDENGDGEIKTMERALEWVLRNGEKNKIRIINISLSLRKKILADRKNHLQDLIEQLVKKDYLIVAAAGNNGPLPMTISEIGEQQGVIAVGCHDMDYRSRLGKNCDEYSARGPGRFMAKKPDLVAPGTDIVSCGYQFQKGLNYCYTAKSGTSMSTALVSGCAGLILTGKKECNAGLVRQILLRNAIDLKEPWEKQGWGMVNPVGMINSVMFG